MLAAAPPARSWPFDALLVVLCVAAFGPAMPAGLIRYDDSLYIFRNTELLGRPGWEGLAGVWDGSRAWSGQFVEFFPLRDTIYWLIYQRWETWGLPYHLASLAFHVLASVLALRLALALGTSRWVAVAAAAIFAVHPIHIESVAWASGLKDPMYTAFVFASLLAWAREKVALALSFFVAALLVKSMALSLPLLLVLMARCSASPTPWLLLFKRLSAFFAVAALFLVQFVLIGKANAAVVGPHGGDWSSHVVLSVWAQAKYLKQALVPSTFRLIYCFEPPTGLSDPRLWAGLAVLALAAALAWWWRKQPLLLFGVAWYFACLLPVSNLVPFPAVMADRYLYAAVFGVSLVLALLLERLFARTQVLVAVVLVVTLTCAARSTLWLDEENLWAETDEDPACLVDRDRPAVDAHLLRFRATRDPRVALQAIERALVTPALGQTNHFCEAHQNGALLAAELGEADRAEAWARTAIARCPFEGASWSALAMATAHRKPEDARSAAERAWRLEPSFASQALFGLLAAEAGDGAGEAMLLDAVRRGPAEACPVLVPWKAAPSNHAEARAACASP